MGLFESRQVQSKPGQAGPILSGPVQSGPDADAICTLAGLEALNTHPARLLEAPAEQGDLPYGIALMRVATPLHARTLLAPADPEERQRRSAVFYQPKAYRIRERLPLGQHDRMEEFLMADGHLHERDKAGHERHFPIHLKSIRLRELRLAAGEIADLSATRADWPWLHFREELYLRVCIDRLVVAPGATLRWSGNIASVLIGNLTAATTGLTPDAPFTIQVRGTPHYCFSGVRPGATAAGMPGAPGRGGRDGVISNMRQTPFGPQPMPPEPGASEPSGDGGTAMPGQPGGGGTQGHSGGMAMLAGIEILAVEGLNPNDFHLDVQASPGEPGGAGGDGGPGGAGGRGAPGWAHPRRTKTAGQGGNGGAGGDGGAGGKGGAGGLASHIFLTLPQGAHDTLELNVRPAPGGLPGKPGHGGGGGRGGPGGIGVDHPFVGKDPDGAAGHDGAPGEAGQAGSAGRLGNTPPVWVHAA